MCKWMGIATCLIKFYLQKNHQPDLAQNNNLQNPKLDYFLQKGRLWQSASATQTDTARLLLTHYFFLLHVLVCVSACVCIHVCMSQYVYVCVCICKYMSMFVSVCASVCVSLHVSVCLCVYLCVCIYVCVHVHVISYIPWKSREQLGRTGSLLPPCGTWG